MRQDLGLISESIEALIGKVGIAFTGDFERRERHFFLGEHWALNRLIQFKTIPAELNRI